MHKVPEAAQELAAMDMETLQVGTGMASSEAIENGKPSTFESLRERSLTWKLTVDPPTPPEMEATQVIDKPREMVLPNDKLTPQSPPSSSKSGGPIDVPKSRPSKHRQISDLVRDSKLETQFVGTGVQHIPYVSNTLPRSQTI